jgi:hypothetical protein
MSRIPAVSYSFDQKIHVPFDRTMLPKAFNQLEAVRRERDAAAKA